MSVRFVSVGVLTDFLVLMALRQGRNQKKELKGAKRLVVLLFRLNILILSREGQEKKFLAGAPAPASLPLSPPLLSGIRRWRVKELNECCCDFLFSLLFVFGDWRFFLFFT